MEYFAVAAALFALLATLLAGLAWRAASRGPTDEQLSLAVRRSTEPLFNQHKDLLEKAVRAEATLARQEAAAAAALTRKELG